MQLELLKTPKGLTKATWGSANFQEAVSYDHKPDIVYEEQGSKIC